MLIRKVSAAFNISVTYSGALSRVCRAIHHLPHAALGGVLSCQDVSVTAYVLRDVVRPAVPLAAVSTLSTVGGPMRIGAAVDQVIKGGRL